MKFPFRQILAGGIAAMGLASALIHPSGDIKGNLSDKALLKGSSADITVLRVVEKSCQNCHSQRTAWPWFSYVAPASWMIEKDVSDGRRHMDLSRWDEYPVEEQSALLAAIGAAVRNHVMPPPRYLYLHPEAKVTDAEADHLYQWTKRERGRLRSLETAVPDGSIGGGR